MWGRSSKDKSCQETICRDFLRNVCRRGNSCKFRHDQDDSSASDEGAKLQVPPYIQTTVWKYSVLWWTTEVENVIDSIVCQKAALKSNSS
jgi:hypothetical protein